MSYTPQTWSDSPSTSTPISAARLTVMENGIAAASALSYFRRTRVSTTAFASTTTLAVMPASVFDTADQMGADMSYNSASQNSLTVTIAGIYAVVLCAKHVTTGTIQPTPADLGLFKNGSAIRSGAGWGGDLTDNAFPTHSHASWLVKLAANDVLQPASRTATAGSLFTGVAGGIDTYWEVALIQAA